MSVSVRVCVYECVCVCVCVHKVDTIEEIRLAINEMRFQADAECGRYFSLAIRWFNPLITSSGVVDVADVTRNETIIMSSKAFLMSCIKDSSNYHWTVCIKSLFEIFSVSLSLGFSVLLSCCLSLLMGSAGIRNLLGRKETEKLLRFNRTGYIYIIYIYIYVMPLQSSEMIGWDHTREILWIENWIRKKSAKEKKRANID